jgi:hypothetical protein
LTGFGLGPGRLQFVTGCRTRRSTVSVVAGSARFGSLQQTYEPGSALHLQKAGRHWRALVGPVVTACAVQICIMSYCWPICHLLCEFQYFVQMCCAPPKHARMPEMNLLTRSLQFLFWGELTSGNGSCSREGPAIQTMARRRAGPQRPNFQGWLHHGCLASFRSDH